MKTVVDLFAQLNDLYIKKKNKKAELLYSKNTLEIIKFFCNYGIIKNYKIVKKNSKYKIEVIFLYFDNKPVLQSLKIISTGSLKVYKNVSELKRLLYKKQVIKYVISTSKGIFLAENCIKKNIGGKVIGKFF